MDTTSCGIALVFALVAMAWGQPPSNTPTPSISVVGNGQTSAPPDMAEIQVGVVSESPSATDATRANSQSMKQLLAQLTEQGIDKKDVQTAQFAVSPVYQQDGPRRGRSPNISGYRVTNLVTLRVRNLDNLGAILDAVVQEGANTVSGIRFSIQQPEDLQDAARRLAVDDARRKASVLAEQAGTKLGRVLSIQDHAYEPRPMYGRAMAMAADSASVPIEAGEQTLTATVQVTYALD